MKKLILLLALIANAIVASAQIGYQVSLLNSATGEPRANVTVNCTVTLTNSEGGVIYTGTQIATSNDFGIVSLTIGDSNTFSNVDWTKLPLFVEVSVDGKLIGKSQVLSVPLAECAKQLVPNENIYGTWILNRVYTGTYSKITISENGTMSTHDHYFDYAFGNYYDIVKSGTYITIGDFIILDFGEQSDHYMKMGYYHAGTLHVEDYGEFTKQ